MGGGILLFGRCRARMGKNLRLCGPPVVFQIIYTGKEICSRRQRHTLRNDGEPGCDVTGRLKVASFAGMLSAPFISTGMSGHEWLPDVTGILSAVFALMTVRLAAGSMDFRPGANRIYPNIGHLTEKPS